MSRRIAVALVMLATVAVGLGDAPDGRAADECKGLQVCVPVEGPWVAIPAPKGGAPSSAVWLLRCPLRGYIVAGIDARVSDRAIDVSFRGENGAPVSPGVTTGSEVLFTAVYTGTRRRATSFRPYLGCIPTSGGGGRALTALVRSGAYAPGRPIERRVVQKRLVSGATVRVVQRCPAGTRLLGSEHAYAFHVGAEPGATLLGAVHVRRTSSARTVSATAAVAPRVPQSIRVDLQLHALCTRVTP